MSELLWIWKCLLFEIWVIWEILWGIIMLLFWILDISNLNKYWYLNLSGLGNIMCAYYWFVSLVFSEWGNICIFECIQNKMICYISEILKRIENGWEKFLIHPLSLISSVWEIMFCFVSWLTVKPLFIKLLKIIYFYISYSINGENMNTIFIFLFLLLSCKKTFITIFDPFFVFVIVLFCFDKICREI